MTITDDLRRDFAAAARAHQQRVHRTLRSCRGAILTLRTDREWIADTVKFVAQRRRGLAAGVG